MNNEPTSPLGAALHAYASADDYLQDALAVAIWHLMSSGARDNLHALVKSGPLWDGDVPSKAGRDELLHMGFACKVVVRGEQGFQAATYTGYHVHQQGYLIPPAP